eukprot:g77138.t1
MTHRRPSKQGTPDKSIKHNLTFSTPFPSRSETQTVGALRCPVCIRFCTHEVAVFHLNLGNPRANFTFCYKIQVSGGSGMFRRAVGRCCLLTVGVWLTRGTVPRLQAEAGVQAGKEHAQAGKDDAAMSSRR